MLNTKGEVKTEICNAKSTESVILDIPMGFLRDDSYLYRRFDPKPL